MFTRKTTLDQDFTFRTSQARWTSLQSMASARARYIKKIKRMALYARHLVEFCHTLQTGRWIALFTFWKTRVRSLLTWSETRSYIFQKHYHAQDLFWVFCLTNHSTLRRKNLKTQLYIHGWAYRTHKSVMKTELLENRSSNQTEEYENVDLEF